jgi:GAF domain-containing protein
MGALAKEFFDKASALGGLRAKIRLATLARVTSAEAATLDETPEIVQALERALDTVKAEFGPQARRDATDGLPARSGDVALGTLRKHVDTFLELMTQRSLFLGDAQTTFRRITEGAAVAIDVARVSVWLVDKKVTKIVCADLFERPRSTHTAGVELFAADFAPYFTALKEQKTIAAHDAHKDPRTSCFSLSYLTPLGINSMLDVPIWVNQEMVGVVCHEHVGPRRIWNHDEEQFAYLMANFAALAMERAQQSVAAKIA